MELTRLFRVLTDRWRVVALIAAIGFVSAFGFTALNNRQVTHSWEALLALRFEPQGGETLEDVATRLTDSEGLAQLAAEDLLLEDLSSSVFADSASGRLFFRAEGETQELALDKADALLSAYLRSDGGGSDVEGQLQALVTRAEEISAEVEALQPSLTPEQEDLLAQHELFDLMIFNIRDTLVQLQTADAGADSDVRDDNATRRADLEGIRDQLLAQKRALPPPPATELSPADQLRADSLQRQLDVIGLEYDRLSLLAAGLTTDDSIREAPRLSSLAPQPSSPLLNGLIGMIGGAGIAVFALVFITRSRKEIWLPEDLPVPLIAEVPNRKVSSLPGPSWYDSTQGGRRKEAIQAVRTAIEGVLGPEPAALALIGDSVGSTATHALAADLAGSVASSGRAVLLVDADFSEEVEMTEFAVGEPSLASVLALPGGPGDALNSAIARTLDSVVRLRTDLAVMPPGPSPSSPADALSGPQFRRFVEVARQSFDLVLVVGGESGSASARVLGQRLGTALVAVAPGRSTVPRVDAVLVDLSQQRVALPGVIMLHGGESRLQLARTRPVSLRPTRSVGYSSTPSTASRLGSYPFPGSKRSGTPSQGTLDQLAAGISLTAARDDGSGFDESVAWVDRIQPDPAGMAPDPIGMQVIDALRAADKGKAYAPVADYLVARVEDMLTAVPGQANVTQEMMDVATDLAFVPLTPIEGVPTVWDRFVAEVEHEVGARDGRQVASLLSEILTDEQDVESHAVDVWLSQEFFHRHLQRTDRQPDVWHISSQAGSVQLLVNGRRLTDDRIGKLTIDVVRRKIHELNRDLKELRLAGRSEAAELIDADLKDAHRFEVSLGMLRGGTSDEARLIYPWRRQDQMPTGWQPVWSEGIRANIAPLQKLDLLPEPVLTEEELKGLAPAR